MASMRVAIVTRWEGDIETLAGLLQLTHALNVAYLLANPGTTPLYDSGVRYKRERRPDACLTAEPEERFLTVPELYEEGEGDCDDIAPARSAELTVNGFPSEPFPVTTQLGYHVLVRTPFGIEDPCRVLGMGQQP